VDNYGHVAGTGTVNNTASVTANQTNLQTASASISLSKFNPGVAGSSIGFWYNHQSQWQVGNNGGVLLGDANGSNAKNGGEVTLNVPTAAAAQLINSSQTAADARQILLSQALGAQLNIEAGDKDPGAGAGGATVGLDLITTAVHWLENNGPFAYSAHGGQVDYNTPGVLDTNTLTKTTTGYDYNSVNKTFTSTALSSNSDAWNTRTDIKVADSNSSVHDFWVSGQDLKNALQAFDQNQLMTSSDGSLVAWNTNGSASDIHGNSAFGMWTVLQDHGMAHSSATG
jgi:hypothetical protein